MTVNFEGQKSRVTIFGVLNFFKDKDIYSYPRFLMRNDHLNSDGYTVYDLIII